VKNKIAFLCVAHNNFTYLEELSKYYCSDGDGFFLHIDSNAPRNLLKNIDERSTLIPLDESYRTRWGTINIALASLKVLEKALSDKSYEQFILVSGADTPLLSKKELKENLKADRSYLSVWQETTQNSNSKLQNEFFKRHFYHSFFTNPGETYLTKSRARIYFMLIVNKIIAFIPLKNKFNYSTYAKGSQWWCLTRELASFISEELKYPENRIQFQSMHAPDEKIFHTVALNSPFRKKIVIDEGQDELKQGLHYIDWGLQKKEPRLQSFTPDNVEKAKALGCCFARKVDSENVEYFINYVKQLRIL
jgi:hypothetical protein